MENVKLVVIKKSLQENQSQIHKQGQAKQLLLLLDEL